MCGLNITEPGSCAGHNPRSRICLVKDEKEKRGEFGERSVFLLRTSVRTSARQQVALKFRDDNELVLALQLIHTLFSLIKIFSPTIYYLCTTDLKWLLFLEERSG